MITPDNEESVMLGRRDVLKTLGAGAALLGLGIFSTRVWAAGVEGGPVAALPFALPKLSYGFADLEPHIDARTMEIHYSKHHQAYVSNANKALAEHPELLALGADALLAKLDQAPEKLRMVLRNNLGGHVNHTFFWELLSPHGGGEPVGKLAAEITQTFGGLAAFKTQFAEAAMKRFGSGWAWLVVANGKLVIKSTANQDSPLLDGEIPVLGLDVWEHAYYLHYQNRRADYVSAFWNIVHWERAEMNFSQARQ